MNPLDRIFALHRALDKRRVALPMADIQRELDDCSPATAKRVVAYLRDRLGAPLTFDREAGGYRYRSGEKFELPGLWFSARELSALLTLEQLTADEPSGLVAESLKPFRQKIADLLAREGVGLPDWHKRLRLMRAQARSPGEFFTAVSSALAQRRRLTIRYLDRGREQFSEREISPQRLVLYRDNWYLDAWCHQRQAPRRFAIERLIAAKTLQTEAHEAAPAEDADAAAYGIFSGAASTWAELHFSEFATRWVADEFWHPEQTDRHLDDGSMIRRLPYNRPEELAMDLLRHGAEVEVLEPPSLRALIVQRLRTALDHYVSAPTDREK